MSVLCHLCFFRGPSQLPFFVSFVFLGGYLVAVCGVAGAGTPTTAAAKPNIVIIYSDDIGWGDLGCYGATKVSTPQLDRLASNGLRFTDAHTTASTCTPSRFSILTGQYAFRNKAAQILPGDAPLLIVPGSPTLPQLLKDHGYVTACIGKWHLGLGDGSINWNTEVKPGPMEIGFDESFIVPATPDRVPCVYVEGHEVVHLESADPLRVSYKGPIGDEPTGREHPELLRYKGDAQHSGTIVDRISRIGWMAGGHSAWWTDEQMAMRLTERAEDFLTRNAKQPFFLYFAINDIHVPRAPNPDFVGKSQCGLRGDQIEELDWTVGQILSKLEELHLTGNTLVIFSSDNGPILADGYADGSIRDANGHKPAGPFRGGKYQIYEGGTRVPLLTYWPGHVKPGVSSALTCQVDFLASLMDLTGITLPPDAGPDSQDLLATLLNPDAVGRDQLVEQAEAQLAIRKGRWKFIPGGTRTPLKRLEEGDTSSGPASSPAAQLYDLSTDEAEKNNVVASHPDVVNELTRLIHEDTSSSRTRQ
jgi:arylsulfatase A-like enzyme